ncbi:hypothetical protein KW794_03235 [Candidatus Saccharibacteria bacterium]|nr:hypothetical protein [Candidatus Saccharibacteria bacterium]
MKWLRFFGLAPLLMFILGGVAFAQYSSTNYSANEVFFGSGGDNNQSSANYNASVAAGALGVGRYSSANYIAYSGFLTPGEPFLELGIDSSAVDMGNLDPATTVTGAGLFHVRAYINTGYTVQTLSQPPSYTSGAQTHSLSAMSSLAASSVGTEQFGINLVHNTSPANFGTDPSPQPNGTYATGIAAPGYDTADQFKYVVGNTIAKTPSGSSGWGLTNYTIAYIANASIITPAGEYKMVQDLVAIATY